MEQARIQAEYSMIHGRVRQHTSRVGWGLGIAYIVLPLGRLDVAAGWLTGWLTGWLYAPAHTASAALCEHFSSGVLSKAASSGTEQFTPEHRLSVHLLTRYPF